MQFHHYDDSAMKFKNLEKAQTTLGYKNIAQMIQRKNSVQTIPCFRKFNTEL